MNTTYELNNLRKDSDIPGRINKQSPIVEVFSAMVNGEELSKFGAKADKAVSYIKELGSRADAGDFTAVAELNSLRRFIVEAPIMQELKLLNIFGSYQHVGFDETVEREVWDYAGEPSRIQAAGGDVPYTSATKRVYPVPTFTVSGGYSVDYRRISLGDMDKENDGLARVKTDIMNRAIVAIINKVYKALNDATGVKYHAEGAPMTKTSVDGVLRDIRGFGKPTVLGSYAILSQFTPWAGYVGKIDANTITGVSEKTMNEIAQNGIAETVMANMKPGVLSSIIKSIDENIEYKTGIQQHSFEKSLTELVESLTEKVNAMDISSLNDVLSKVASMQGNFTPENVLNAYMGTDMFKDNAEKRVEISKKNAAHIIESIGNSSGVTVLKKR